MEFAEREASLQFTPRGIPVSLRPAFQEFVLEDLDPVRDGHTVIGRTLAWGDIPELRWVFRLYGLPRVREWVQRYGWRGLPTRRLKFWLCVLDIHDFQHGERLWPH